VVDLNVLFGRPPVSCIKEVSAVVAEVVFDNLPVTISFLADAVHEVLELKIEDIEPPPSWGSKVDSSFISGIAKCSESFVILLDLERIISSAQTVMLE
jgi:purine-binding chemotaxis protein CheW